MLNKIGRITHMQSNSFSQVFDESERLDTKSTQSQKLLVQSYIGKNQVCCTQKISALCLGCHRTWRIHSGCAVRVGKCIWTGIGIIPDNTFATFPWNSSDTIRSLAICMSKASWFKAKLVWQAKTKKGVRKCETGAKRRSQVGGDQSGQLWELVL